MLTNAHLGNKKMLGQKIRIAAFFVSPHLSTFDSALLPSACFQSESKSADSSSTSGRKIDSTCRNNVNLAAFFQDFPEFAHCKQDIFFEWAFVIRAEARSPVPFFENLKTKPPYLLLLYQSYVSKIKLSVDPFLPQRAHFELVPLPVPRLRLLH